MKQLIVPIATIVVLIAFFVVVDHKEFSRLEDVPTVQNKNALTGRKKTTIVPQTKSATEVKPAVKSYLAETKPVNETKPVTEAKRATEVKPKTDTKPADNKTVAEKKPSAGKPVAETKPEEKLLPAAVPVVTQEEAEKLNEFAIFLSSAKTTVVEGEVIERSILPDPQKSDYPNCRFTAHFRGNAIKSGESCPKELSLIVEGFEKYRVLPSNDIKNGDKILCTVIPFEQLPEDYQSTQQADDLELFLLESWYVIDIKTINDFTDNELMPVSGICFTDNNDDYISLFERHINPSIPNQVKIDYELSVRKDKERMNLLLDGIDDEKIKEINRSFAEAWIKEKAKDPPNYNRVGNFVWRNLDNSFWTFPTIANILSKPDKMSQKMLDCFLSLKKVLEANGVQLIVSLVPSNNAIAARLIVKDFKDIPDTQTATYVKQLSEIGIETIYPSDSIIKNYNRFPFAFFLPSDAHPSDTTQDVIADILAERLKRYEITPELDPTLFSEVQSPHFAKDREDFLFPQNCDIGENQAGKSFMCRDILYNGEKIKRSKDASIMVVGNSFIQTPMGSPDSLPVILSYKCCSPVDWYSITGGGPFSDILIQLLLNPDSFLKNKKVFIFQVGTLHITEFDHKEAMLDIAILDSERILLNKKKQKVHFLLQSNTNTDQIEDSELWGPLSNVEKTVLRIDETGALDYSFTLEQAGDGISISDPIVCVIPHTCVRNTSCKITINGITQLMHSPNHAYNQRFFNLAYELPAGTKEITMKIEGKPGALIAIKDIQIWQ